MEKEEFLNKLPEFYSEDYFTGKRDECNYVAGFGGTWYNEVVAWLATVLTFEDKILLDAGCAVGAYSKAFLEAGALVLGVDISEFAIAKAEENFENSEFSEIVQFLQSSLHDLSEVNDDSVDIYFTAEVFEHLHPDTVADAIKEAHRVLVPGGIFYLQTPMLDKNPQSDVDSELEKNGHATFKSMKEWNKLITSFGFTLQKEMVKKLQEAQASNELTKQYLQTWNYLIYTK